MNRYVYSFSEIENVKKLVKHDWPRVRSFLGGKGASLAEMSHLGILVLPGFTITTDACIEHLASGGNL